MLPDGRWGVLIGLEPHDALPMPGETVEVTARNFNRWTAWIEATEATARQVWVSTNRNPVPARTLTVETADAPAEKLPAEHAAAASDAFPDLCRVTAEGFLQAGRVLCELPPAAVGAAVTLFIAQARSRCLDGFDDDDSDDALAVIAECLRSWSASDHLERQGFRWTRGNATDRALGAAADALEAAAQALRCYEDLSQTASFLDGGGELSTAADVLRTAMDMRTLNAPAALFGIAAAALETVALCQTGRQIRLSRYDVIGGEETDGAERSEETVLQAQAVAIGAVARASSAVLAACFDGPNTQGVSETLAT